MALDKGAVALILGFGFIILLPTLIKKAGYQQNEGPKPQTSTAKPKATGNPGITERGARYGFLKLNEAEYGEAIGTGRYPEPKRYEELTKYYAEPHEPGWKGLSLAEMFPTKYKDLLSRGVPDKLSPSEVQQVIKERRIPYERRVEYENH